MPPWPRRVSEPMIPGPGPTIAASQPAADIASSAPATDSASSSPPYAGAAVMCPHRRPRSRRRPRRDSVSPVAPRRRSARSRPRNPDLSCAAAHAAGARWPCRRQDGGHCPAPRLGVPFRPIGGIQQRKLDRRDRVLERAVVQLHHVLALGAPRRSRPPGEVDVDDVEAARAEPEVARLDVDDHLVAGLASLPPVPCRPMPGAARRRPRP